MNLEQIDQYIRNIENGDIYMSFFFQSFTAFCAGVGYAIWEIGKHMGNSAASEAGFALIVSSVMLSSVMLLFMWPGDGISGLSKHF